MIADVHLWRGKSFFLFSVRLRASCSCTGPSLPCTCSSPPPGPRPGTEVVRVLLEKLCTDCSSSLNVSFHDSHAESIRNALAHQQMVTMKTCTGISILPLWADPVLHQPEVLIGDKISRPKQADSEQHFLPCNGDGDVVYEVTQPNTCSTQSGAKIALLDRSGSF